MQSWCSFFFSSLLFSSLFCNNWPFPLASPISLLLLSLTLFANPQPFSVSVRLRCLMVQSWWGLWLVFQLGFGVFSFGDEVWWSSLVWWWYFYGDSLHGDVLMMIFMFQLGGSMEWWNFRVTVAAHLFSSLVFFFFSLHGRIGKVFIGKDGKLVHASWLQFFFSFLHMSQLGF